MDPVPVPFEQTEGQEYIEGIVDSSFDVHLSLFLYLEKALRTDLGYESSCHIFVGGLFEGADIAVGFRSKFLESSITKFKL